MPSKAIQVQGSTKATYTHILDISYNRSHNHNAPKCSLVRVCVFMFVSRCVPATSETNISNDYKHTQTHTLNSTRSTKRMHTLNHRKQFSDSIYLLIHAIYLTYNKHAK